MLKIENLLLKFKFLFSEKFQKNAFQLAEELKEDFFLWLKFHQKSKKNKISENVIFFRKIQELFYPDFCFWTIFSEFFCHNFLWNFGHMFLLVIFTRFNWSCFTSYQNHIRKKHASFFCNFFFQFLFYKLFNKLNLFY